MSACPDLNLTFLNGNHHYSDGESEQHLLDLFQRECPQDEAKKILASDPSWPMLYHLSPLRHNLLSWYDFAPSSTLLEVGAGCGALTGLLCDRLHHVTAVELTKARAEILYHRHKQHNNLEIVAGSINEIVLNCQFDYVTCIGVLEYAAQFATFRSPYQHFATRLRSFLKAEGTLILAIENKFGLKYWAGCNEDHTGKLFESLENYPLHRQIRTFGRHELERLLSEAGFQDLSFYYPLPDYKLPSEIFSDRYLPSKRHGIRSGLLPTPEFAAKRVHLFDERLVMDSIICDQGFPTFANSFLVFARASA